MSPSPPPSTLPPLTVLTGSARAGKTAACLERFRQAEGRARLVVPSEPYAQQGKDRLGEIGYAGDLSGVTTFGKLIEGITARDDLSRALAATPIRPAFRCAALADLVRREVGESGYFGRMRDSGGFVSALGEAIRELKLSRVTPEALEAGAGAAAEL